MRLAVIDDHALVRAGLRSLLEGLPGVQEVREAGDGQEALMLIETYRPDVMFMDVHMPRLNGLEALGRITSEHPHVRVVVLSMYSTEEYVLRALKAGAAGYVLKDAEPEELEAAVRAVIRGDSYLCSRISKLVTAYVQRAAQGNDPLERLTPRQREVLQLIAEGHTTKEIARILDLSVKTVDTYRSQLMQLLEVRNVTGLVKQAIRMGLISNEEF